MGDLVVQHVYVLQPKISFPNSLDYQTIGCTVAHMPTTPSPLEWDQSKIVNLMRRNNIKTRHALAQRLGTVARATVYESFNSDWSGHPTKAMMEALASYFGINIGRYLADQSVCETRRHGCHS